MAVLSWLGQEAALSPAALTVRAQTISPNDNGNLLWDRFFPRENVDSVKIREITTLDVRPVADRREWNARGRYIPLTTPKTADFEMVPIESFFSINEREIQELEERTFGNEELFRQLVGARVPNRTDGLVAANYRRIELDAFKLWAQNQIVVMNPVTGATVTTAFGFDAARYQTAGTAWNNVGVNAYTEFIAWLEDAIDAVGPIQGAMMRLATFKAIQEDAPQGVDAVQLTRLQVEDRVQQDIAMPFRFYINELSLDVFNDGGTATTRTKVWPAEQVAVVPAGERVGTTKFAPVARAMDLARQVPEAKIDVRGVSVFHESANGARSLTIEAQVNALPMPNEQLLYVIDAGV